MLILFTCTNKRVYQFSGTQGIFLRFLHYLHGNLVIFFSANCLFGVTIIDYQWLLNISVFLSFCCFLVHREAVCHCCLCSFIVNEMEIHYSSNKTERFHKDNLCHFCTAVLWIPSGFGLGRMICRQSTCQRTFCLLYHGQVPKFWDTEIQWIVFLITKSKICLS